MLFSKDNPPRCAWCRHGSQLDDDTVLCDRKGPVDAAGACRRYRYDPFKRTPPPRAKPRPVSLDGEDLSDL